MEYSSMKSHCKGFLLNCDLWWFRVSGFRNGNSRPMVCRVEICSVEYPQSPDTQSSTLYEKGHSADISPSSLSLFGLCG